MKKRQLMLVKYVNQPISNWHLVDLSAEEDPKDTAIVEYTADSIPQMLHDIQNAKDERFFLYLEAINDRHQKRRDRYPNHYEIHLAIGFIPEVCDISDKLHDKPYDAKWSVSYPGELWVREGDVMQKVQGFSEKIDEDALEFIRENGLE